MIIWLYDYVKNKQKSFSKLNYKPHHFEPNITLERKFRQNPNENRLVWVESMMFREAPLHLHFYSTMVVSPVAVARSGADRFRRESFLRIFHNKKTAFDGRFCEVVIIYSNNTMQQALTDPLFIWLISISWLLNSFMREHQRKTQIRPKILARCFQKNHAQPSHQLNLKKDRISLVLRLWSVLEIPHWKALIDLPPFRSAASNIFQIHPS